MQTILNVLLVVLLHSSQHQIMHHSIPSYFNDLCVLNLLILLALQTFIRDILNKVVKQQQVSIDICSFSVLHQFALS